MNIIMMLDNVIGLRFKKELSNKWQRTVGIELDRDEAIDIDTPDDFKMAEKLYKLTKIK